MLKHKKTVSVSLMFVLLLTAYFAGVPISETAKAVEPLSIKFAAPQVNAIFGFLDESTIKHASSPMSGKWTPESAKKTTNEVPLETYGIETDWSDYDYINLRIYSSAANNAVITFIANTEDIVARTNHQNGGDSTLKDAYFYKQFTIDWAEEWKVISLPLRRFSSAWGAAYWDKVEKLYLNHGDWGTTFIEGTTLYFDEIWLSAESGQEDTPYTLLSFDNPDTINAFSGGTGYSAFVEETNIVRAPSVRSAKWTGGNKGGINYPPNTTLPSSVDISQYKYVNLSVYSGSYSNQNVEIALLPSTSIGGLSDLKWYYGRFKTDWSNKWRVVSFKVEDLVAYAYSGEPPTSKIINSIVFTSTEDANTVLYLDKLWLSNIEPSQDKYTPTPVIPLNDKNKIINGFRNFTEDTTHTSSYDKSLKWTPVQGMNDESGALRLADNGIESDWRKYNYMNMRVYSENANNAAVSVVVHTAEPMTVTSDGNPKDTYYYKAFDINWEGDWKVISLPFYYFKAGWNPASWANMRSILFNATATGWDAKYVEGTVLYFDEIWLSKEPVTEEHANDPDPEDSIIVAKLNSASEIARNSNYLNNNITTNSANRITTDTTITRMYDVSAKLNAQSSATPDFLTAERGMTDVRGYKTLNQWIYSEKATGGKIVAAVYAPSHARTKAYFYTTIDIDWEGWKLVSIPLAQFAVAYNASWQYAANVLYTSNGWGAAPVEETVLYFDKIWFSKYDITAPEFISSNPADNFNEVPVSTNNITIEFDRILRPTTNPEVVSVTKGESDTPVDNYSVSVREKQLIVEFNEQLEYSTKYTITLNEGLLNVDGQECILPDGGISFTTLDVVPIAVSEIASADNTYSLKVTLTNKNETEAFEGSVIVSLLNSNKEIVAVKEYVFSVDEGVGSTQDIPVSITLDSGEHLTAESAKVFTWDNLSDITPFYQRLDVDF